MKILYILILISIFEVACNFSSGSNERPAKDTATISTNGEKIKDADGMGVPIILPQKPKYQDVDGMGVPDMQDSLKIHRRIKPVMVRRQYIAVDSIKK